MPSLTEIESYRKLIKQAQDVKEKVTNTYLGISDTMPTGFYNEQQLDRFLRVRELLTDTTADFMSDLRLGYSLRERYVFNGNIFFGFMRDMKFVLDVGEDSDATSQTREKIYFSYKAVKKGWDDILSTSFQPVLVPSDYGEIRGDVLQPTSAFILMKQAKDDSILVYPGLEMKGADINESQISHMLKIVLANPRISLSSPVSA